MIFRSIFTVSCPSCGAPLALTNTLGSRSDEPRADSLEISRFLPSFLGKMAFFGNCCRQDQRACGRQHRWDEPSTGWNKRCIVLLSHEYALSGACQVCGLQRSRRQEGHQQTAVEAVCAKVALSWPRNSQLLTHDNDKELLTRRSCSNRMQMQRTTRTSCLTRRSCGEKELCRELSPQSVLGNCDFPSHMKKLTLLGNGSPSHPFWWCC